MAGQPPWAEDSGVGFELSAVEESVPLARARVAAWAERLGLSQDQLHALMLALTEAVDNSVVHAYRDRRAGTFRVRAERVNNQVVLGVEDFGVGMRTRQDSPGIGLGLVLIANLVTAWTITCMPERDAGTEVRMVL